MHAPWSRRKLLAAATAAAAPVALHPRLLLAQPATPTAFTLTEPPYIEVETAAGRVRGGHSRGALAFKGIPYAGEVTGAARFKEAPPPHSWTGVRDALQLGPPSLQAPGGTYGENEPAYGENCLVLNIWTPSITEGRKRPVMVYCHGGGYTSGSGGSKDEDGARLAATYDVVVVTTNHRLGLLGYLYLGEIGGAEYASSGNQGVLDIVAALRWLKTNIEAFGGDPSNVMIWGESGGGFKVGTLLAMPAAQGLFHKACIESGSQLRRLSQAAATQSAQRVLQGLGVGANELHKLADIPAEAFVKMQLQPQGAPEVGPVVDGAILPTHPFDPVAAPTAARIPLIVGYNHDEATFFNRERPEVFRIEEPALISQAHAVLGENADRILAAYKAHYPQASPSELYIAIETAMAFGSDSIALAERKSLQPAPVYAYRYDHRSNTPIAGTDWQLRAGHATEIAIMSYNYDIPGLQGNGPGVAEVSQNMSALWASFARHGRPSAHGVPVWPRYDIEQRATLIIDARCRVVKDPDRPIRELWESLRR